MTKDKVLCDKNKSKQQFSIDCTALCPKEFNTTKYDVKYIGKKLNPPRDDFVRILAYYYDLSYLETTQIPKTSKTSLVSEIGGTLGVFLELSLLSFVDIIEILVEVMFMMFRQFNKIQMM